MALIASSCPMTRLCSSSSMCSSREDSSSVSLTIGMPVEAASTSAMTSSLTVVTASDSPWRQAFSLSSRSDLSFCSSSRREAASSKSCPSIASSFFLRVSSMRASNSLSSGGAVRRRIRSRAPASSIRSMALSGRKRSLT